MKTFLLAGLVLVFVVPASAQAPRGRPFLRDTLSSPQEYAEIIMACNDSPRGSKLVASCGQLVESFNRRFTHVHVANERELAEYISDLAVKPCPSGRFKIARIVDGAVDLDYEREARVGELCLYDTGEARFISSMSCGQWIGGTQPVFTAMITQEEMKAPLREQAMQPQTVGGDNGRRLEIERQQAPPPAESHYAWYNPKGTKGKLVWGGVATGTAVALCVIFECGQKTVVINRFR